MRVELDLDVDGCVVAINAAGHAQLRGEQSLSCGIVSSALRSFGLWVLDQPGLLPQGNASQPGDLFLQIRRLGSPPAGQFSAPIEKLLGASQLLVRLLEDLQREFPTDIQLVKNIEEK
jgi:hypothetical protein